MERLSPLLRLKFEEGIIDKGLFEYLADYNDDFLDGHEVGDLIPVFQDVLADIESGLRKLGVKLDPLKEHYDG